MPVIRELVAKLGFDVDNQAIRSFDVAIDAAKISMAGLERQVDAIGKKTKRFGIGLTAFVTAPLTLIAGGMVKAASDAEETGQRFDVVFRDISEGANKIASDFGKDFGIARDKTKELLGTTGDLLTGFEFTQEQALDLANQVARLGGDLASFNNIAGGTEEAVLRLTKGILGETENLKLLGVVVNQGTKEFKNLVKQIQAARGLTLQQAKAQAILTLAIKQSKNAIGDFARTSKSFANQLRIFRSNVRNIMVEFGKFLLPVANKVLGVFIKIFEIIDSLPRPMKAIILAVGGLIAILGPLLIIVGSLIGSFGFFIIKMLILRRILAFFGLTTLGAFTKALGFILKFITRFTLSGVALRLVGSALFTISLAAIKIIAILALISLAIFLIVDDFNTWLSGGDSVITSLIGRFEDFKNFVLNIARTIKRVFTTFWQALVSGSEDDWNRFIDAVIATGPVLLNAFITVVRKIGELFINLFTGIGKGIVSLIVLLSTRLLTFIETLGKRFGEKLRSSIGNFGKSLLGIGKTGSSGESGNVRLGAAQGLGGANTTNQTNINQNINVEVPPGTSEQQVQFLQDSANKIFDKRFDLKMTDSINATPLAEQ